jgi:hypothetical protein
LLAVLNAQEATAVLLYALIHNLETCRRAAPSLGDAGQTELRDAVTRIEASKRKIEDLLAEADTANAQSEASRFLSRIGRP